MGSCLRRLLVLIVAEPLGSDSSGSSSGDRHSSSNSSVCYLDIAVLSTVYTALPQGLTDYTTALALHTEAVSLGLANVVTYSAALCVCAA
eukprot:2662-Heterococcus_DN1.PRE.4